MLLTLVRQVVADPSWLASPIGESFLLADPRTAVHAVGTPCRPAPSSIRVQIHHSSRGGSTGTQPEKVPREARGDSVSAWRTCHFVSDSRFSGRAYGPTRGHRVWECQKGQGPGLQRAKGQRRRLHFRSSLSDSQVRWTQPVPTYRSRDGLCTPSLGSQGGLPCVRALTPASLVSCVSYGSRGYLRRLEEGTPSCGEVSSMSELKGVLIRGRIRDEYTCPISQQILR